MTALLVRRFQTLGARLASRATNTLLILTAGLAVGTACGGGDGGNGNTPNFSLSLAPAALSIPAGANATTAVTIHRTSLTDAVTLTLSGAPDGVTGSFDPAAPTGDASTLTVSVGAAVAPGVYNLTVDGAAGALGHSAALTLTVPGAPDYALALAPAAVSIVQANSGTSGVTITRTNFTGAVTLSLGGAPAGVTGAFAPAAPTGTTSTLTISVSAAVAPGVYNLTVDGTGTAGDHSTALVLTVTAAAADYSLSLSAPAFTVAPSATGTSIVTLTRTNFAGAVNLSLGGAPAGVTGAFAPAAPTGVTSTLTVTVGAAVAAGVYNLTVNGTGTAGDRSTALTLTVSAAPDYSLSLAPAALSITQATTGTSIVTLTRSNFTTAVTLSLGGAPAGVTGAFAPAAPTGTTSTLTVTVGAVVAPGVYNLTVDGTGTAGARSTPLTLTVVATPDYALSIVPDTVTIVQGATGTGAVTIARTNFAGSVALSLSGAPAGVTGALAPAATTGTTSTLTLTVGAAVAPGAYPLLVNGTGAPGARSTPVVLKVTAAAADYALSLSSAAVSVIQGGTGTSTVTITRTNFTGAVTLSLGGAPTGVTGAYAPAAPTGTTSTLTISVAGTVAAGTYNLTVNGASTAGAHSTPLVLTVTAAAANYSLSMTPATLAVVKGTSGTSTVNIIRTNFAGAVTLSLTGAPAGVTGAFNPTAPTTASSVLTLTVGGAVAAGNYSLTVHGTGTPGARTTPLTLTVTATTGGSFTLDFSNCGATEQPTWFAVQDGSGPWAVVTGSSNVYTFTIASTKGAYAVHTTGGNVAVQYGTTAELSARGSNFCSVDTVGKTINGTVAGLISGDNGIISLGGDQTFVGFGSSTFQLNDVASGSQDLVGFRRSTTARLPSAVIRRGLNIANAGTVGRVNFDSTEAFTPDSATITLAGLLGGETVSSGMQYATGASCQSGSLYSFSTAGASYKVLGIPSGHQVASDYHTINVSASLAPDSRFMFQSFHTLAARTVTLGPVLPAPTVTSLTGPYKRLQAVYTQPVEYSSSSGFSYSDGAQFVSLRATQAYFGNTSITLAMPDFSALAGWDNNWAPASASTGTWDLNAAGIPANYTQCTEGGTYRVTSKAGTY